jgi:hypothetical protein
MQMDESDEQFENAEVSRDESLASDSNVTTEKTLHLSKHSSPMFPTEGGMQILA